jgi:hypothetical protein
MSPAPVAPVAPRSELTLPSFPRVEVHGMLQNLFLYRNDTDFDRTPPAYNANGQSEGALATVFRPQLTFHVTPHLRLYYEAEIGLAFWGENDPNEQSPSAPDYFILRNRELYTEGDVLGGRVGFKVGYQYFHDSTSLFLGHWIGAAQTWYSWRPDARIGLFIGEVPDLTEDGMNVNQINFNRDIFVFGPKTEIRLADGVDFAAGGHTLYDASVVGRTRWLVAPNAQIAWQGRQVGGSLGAVLQAGESENSGLGGINQTILAWAAQGHADVALHRLGLAFNAMALSPDDSSAGNSYSGAFLYSSRSSSATIMLTEDELRNWYDQLDRTMATYGGGFWQHRAGLFVGDVKATWFLADIFRPAVIVGAASVLNPSNALGHSFVGLETDLNLEFRASDNLVLNLVGGGLFPGGAGAALVNKINLSATDPIYMLEACLMARF